VRRFVHAYCSPQQFKVKYLNPKAKFSGRRIHVSDAVTRKRAEQYSALRWLVGREVWLRAEIISATQPSRLFALAQVSQPAVSPGWRRRWFRQCRVRQFHSTSFILPAFSRPGRFIQDFPAGRFAGFPPPPGFIGVAPSPEKFQPRRGGIIWRFR